METRLPHGSFHGEAIRTDELADLTLTESVYPPGLRIPEHGHERAYFCLVLQGGYTETYRQSGDTACGASTLIFHPAGEVHADRFHGEGGRCFNIELHPAWHERLGSRWPALGVRAQRQGGPLTWLAARIYDEFARRGGDDIASLAIEGLALEMLAELLRASSAVSAPRPNRRPPRSLERAKELLHARFSESLSLAEIAETAGVHPAHLARAFRQHYGSTTGEYVRRLRIEWACRELVRSDTPLVEIALAAGFPHQSHFTRTFKRLAGTTPARFREIHRSRAKAS